MKIHETTAHVYIHKSPCVCANESPNSDKFLNILKHELHKELHKELIVRKNENVDDFVHILTNEIKLLQHIHNKTSNLV